MAAGLSVRPENLVALRERLNDVARRSLKPEQLQPSIRLDAEVTPSELTVERVAELQRLQQTGIGNPSVQVFARGVTHQRPLQRVGAEKKHVKLWISDNQATREAIWWGAGDGELPVGRFDLAFTPQLHEFNGSCSVQLKVLDWRPSG
jgi:single-stranded-DNA-specific exonuclease